MTLILGLDWKARMAARFGGRLHDATFTKATVGSYDANSPGTGPAMTVATYACEALAFGYTDRVVDGERITEGDYRVLVMRGTIELQANDAVAAELDLADPTVNVDTLVVARTAGADGNSVTLELVGDADIDSGELVEVGTNVKLRYLPGSTTVAQLEDLIGASTLVDVGVAGTPGAVLDAGDAMAATALEGGSDATTGPSDAVPAPGDTITVPPPGSTVAKTGRISEVSPITDAFFTCRVTGPVQ